jgi:hypothetical protein
MITFLLKFLSAFILFVSLRGLRSRNECGGGWREFPLQRSGSHRNTLLSVMECNYVTLLGSYRSVWGGGEVPGKVFCLEEIKMRICEEPKEISRTLMRDKGKVFLF